MAIEYTEAFVAMGAADLDAAEAFYTRILSREPDERVPGIYVAYQLPGLHLGIFKPSRHNTAEFTNPPGQHSGLSLVLRVRDIEQARAQLLALDVPKPTSIKETPQGREFYGYDPDGNRIILVEGPPTG